MQSYEQRIGELRLDGTAAGFLYLRIEEWRPSGRGFFWVGHGRSKFEEKLAWHVYLPGSMPSPDVGLYDGDDWREIRNDLFNYKGTTYNIRWLDPSEGRPIYEELFSDE